jgi:hypothetical protein
MKRVFEGAADHERGRPAYNRGKRFGRFKAQPDPIADVQPVRPFAAKAADRKIVNKDFQGFARRLAKARPEPAEDTLFMATFYRPVEFRDVLTGNHLMTYNWAPGTVGYAGGLADAPGTNPPHRCAIIRG